MCSVMKCERWINQHEMSMGQRKKIPIGFEPITSQKPGSTRTHGEQGH